MCGFYFKVWLLSSPLGLTMPWLGLWLTTSLMSCLTSKFATGWVSNNVTRCCKHSCETTTTHIYRKYCWPCRTSTQIGRSRPHNIHQTLRNRSVGTKKTKISLITKISPIFAFFTVMRLSKNCTKDSHLFARVAANVLSSLKSQLFLQWSGSFNSCISYGTLRLLRLASSSMEL